jgi:choline-glycine betaine transporter
MCYTVIGIALGISSNRMGLPLTMRSCFFPILGNMVFGSLGDLIDTLAIVTTVFAVCASMGIGAIQINTGLKELVPSVDQSVTVQVVLIALMTVTAGISAHAGVRKGIRVLSIISFSVLTTLVLAVLLADDTAFLLNLFVQSVGFHLHRIIDLGFQTDAFEQLDLDVDGKGGPEVWMDWWTVFYWGWWVSWSPFVGIFIARISRGRTVGEVGSCGALALSVFAYSRLPVTMLKAPWFCE